MSQCFALIQKNITAEIKEIKKEVDGIKQDLMNVKTKVNSLEGFVEYADDSFKKLNEETIPNLEGMIEVERQERLKLEMWGRK